MVRAGWLFAVCAACGGRSSPEGEPGPPVCDGRLQESEGFLLDAPFDRDGDGWVDGGEPDCAETYGAWALDCDDGDIRRSPVAIEVPCNGIDEDCNDDTPDAVDFDQDGASACDDCADRDNDIFPGAEEVCFDFVDNDCDQQIDEDCGVDYTGEFVLDQTAQYACGLGLVRIRFDRVQVISIGSNLSFFTIDSSQPGAIDGFLEEDASFVLEEEIQLGTGAACDELYRWVGSFDGTDRFEATFEASYSGGFACLDCASYSVDVVGTRIAY